MSVKIRKFTDLIAWKEAYSLVKLIYKFTDEFPRKESYTLVTQMRRAAISVSSNIAEGFSRRTKKEKIQFYFMSHGSLTEPQSQAIIAKGVGYLNKEELKAFQLQSTKVQKLVNGLIKGTEKIHNT